MEVTEESCGLCEFSLANNFRKKSISVTNIINLILYFKRSTRSNANVLHCKTEVGMVRKMNNIVNGRRIML